MQRGIAAVIFIAALAGWFYGPEVGLSVVIAFAAMVGASIAYRNSEEFVRLESRTLDSVDSEKASGLDRTDATLVDIINTSRFPIRIINIQYLFRLYDLGWSDLNPVYVDKNAKPTYKSPIVERIPYDGIMLETGARLFVPLLPEQEPKPMLPYERRPTHIRVSTTTRTYTSPIRSRVPNRSAEIRLRLLWRWKTQNRKGVRAKILKWLVWKPYGCLMPRRWMQPQWKQANQRDEEAMRANQRDEEAMRANPRPDG